MTPLGITVYNALYSSLDAMVQTDWTVYDGPSVVADSPGTVIVLGTDGEERAIESSQQDLVFGGGTEWETGTVYVLISSANGNRDTATARSNVMAAYEDVATACAGFTGYEAHVTLATVRQAQTPNGAEVTAAVEVSYSGALS